MIRRDRETGVTRPHGGQIKICPETPRASRHYDIEGFKGGPLMP